MTRETISPSDKRAIQAVLIAVRQAADAICDRWSFILIAAAFAGETRFGGFLERTGMANRLISSRLKALCDLGVMMRVPYSVRPPRDEFVLTHQGRALLPVLQHMANWDAQWNKGAGPSPLLRSPAGTPLQVTLTCGQCGQATTARDISLKLSRAQLQAAPKKANERRRSTVTSADQQFNTFGLHQSLDIFGDKWSIEIVLIGFFALNRFTDFSDNLGIAASTLIDRLDRLMALGVFRQDTVRGYQLSEKGLALYGILVSIQAWADSWLPQRYKSPVTLIHRGCGLVFKPVTRAEAG
ncbi:MAG: hypothetical protein RL145_1812 [Pseudomonadota bacterium]|jgi:DNA-binding HxlR family transcriptional regulator